MMWLSYWISSWTDILVGFISVTTFCIYRPGWDIDFRFWSAKKIIDERIKLANKNGRP